MGIAGAIRTAAEQAPELGDRLAGPAQILDVGTGVGWLAVALARQYPDARVVGIDIFEPALELARGNVAAEHLQDRIELRRQDVLSLDRAGVRRRLAGAAVPARGDRAARPGRGARRAETRRLADRRHLRRRPAPTGSRSC